MATRLYFNNTAAPYTPTTIRGTWSLTTGAVTKLLGAAHDSGAPATVAVAETNSSTTYNVLWGRWISAPAAVSGNLSGVVSWAVGVKESSLSALDVLRVHIYVTTGSSDTPRGTLLANYTDTVRFTTTAAGISSLDVAISTVAVTAGDRVVVEIGYEAQNSSTSSFTGTMNYGGNQFFRDLVAAQSSGSHGTDPTTGFGWVQFSDPNSVLVAAPTSSANKCPNPAAKTYQDFWSTVSGTTVTQPAETGFSRTTGLHIVMGTVASPTDPNIQPGIAPASAGETWSSYVEIKGSLTSPDTTTCWLNFLDARGNFLTPNPSQTITPTNTAQTVIFNGYTAPTNAASVGISVEGTMSTGDTMDVTCVRYDIAASLSAYADGDSTGWSWDNALTDGDSPSRQNNTPTSIAGDTSSGQRFSGPTGANAIGVVTTGDTPAAHRAAGPSGLGPNVAPAGDSPAAQRSAGPDGGLALGVSLTDSPSAARQAGPDGLMAIGVSLTDSPSAQRFSGPDGAAGVGVTFGPDTPGAQRSGGPDGTAAIDLSSTAPPSGLRSAGPNGSLALGVTTTDTPSAGRYAGPVGSVFADVGGSVSLTDTPSARRVAGPDGALVLSIVLVGDSPSAARFAGPDGVLAIGFVLTDTPSAERDGGPDGVVIAILSDSPSGLRFYGPDGAMGIDLPITADTPSAPRCAGPVGLVGIGIGADVIAGTAAPSGSRYGGPLGEVLLAMLPSRPPYTPSAPTVAPSYTLWVADTCTGRMLWELPAETLSWNNKLNDVGTITTSLSVESIWDALSDQDERDPRIMLREILSGPWRFSLVLKWGNNAVWAGPYLTMSRPTPQHVVLNGAEIAKIFSKRALIKPGAISAVDPTADTSFGPGATKSHVAAALVSQALTGTGNSLPITVTDPGGSGTDARVYYGYDLAYYWDQLVALMAEVDGPEIRFDPQITPGSDGDYVSWVMQVGTPYLGRDATTWVFDSDVTSIVGMDADSSSMAMGVWSSGTGQSRDKLIAHSTDTSLLNLGWPMLESVDNTHTSEIWYPILAAHNAGALDAYKQPVVSFNVMVAADSDPMAGTYRVGQDFSVDVHGDPIIPDGFYTRRIAAINGTEKPWVTITDVGPVPLAAIGPLTTLGGP